jgi:hypothetical protein
MHWRVLCPVGCELFGLKEGHFVNYGIAVSTGGGEEAIEVSPVVNGPESDSGP